MKNITTVALDEYELGLVLDSLDVNYALTKGYLLFARKENNKSKVEAIESKLDQIDSLQSTIVDCWDAEKDNDL